MPVEHVAGKNAGKIMLYALSTCVWCKKTRELLNDLKVEYDYAYVDLMKEDEKKATIETIKKWNPACSFPTVVIDDKKCIVGFKEKELKEALQK
jgi:glutaredoxin